jgi:hypothetical protein
MARRSPPRKVTYFEPVPPRLARNIIIESTFEVGRRFRCTVSSDGGSSSMRACDFAKAGVEPFVAIDRRPLEAGTDSWLHRGRAPRTTPPLWRGRCLGPGRLATETDPLCHRRTQFRICRRGDGVIRWQLPTTAIRCRFEPMRHAQMPAQRLATKPAFEADHVIVRHRPPDRDSRLQRDQGRRRRTLAEATNRLLKKSAQGAGFGDFRRISRNTN